ncbi:folate-binding protein [Microvirga sp. W0021]|uniref:Folate-binding protein n=1 Tax=Hohaiivirga grylli TaxID=3133970 RepID=A0ABV0BJE4_9HYPH
MMAVAQLNDRAIIKISGDDAEGFLQNILTCDISETIDQKSVFGALLSPQGKILFDFILYRNAEGSFICDIASDQAEAFMKRLGFYRLRAKVLIEALAQTYGVFAGWDGAAQPEGTLTSSQDPRIAALGWRAIAEKGTISTDTDEKAYHIHRISLAIPEGGQDFVFGECFPHEADMDQIHGVSFGKGCYIGQEIVSRMQHRGTARTRFIKAGFTGTPPTPLQDVTVGDRLIGKSGSSTRDTVLIMVRLDKASDAIEAGLPIICGEAVLSPEKPEWATFAFPLKSTGD